MLHFFQKIKKISGDIIILHLCTKNLDDMIHSSWDIERDGPKIVFFRSFFALLPP